MYVCISIENYCDNTNVCKVQQKYNLYYNNSYKCKGNVKCKVINKWTFLIQLCQKF